MPRVAALYRYPVKGFTPEPCTGLTVLPEGRVAGDRVLAFRFANAPVADAVAVAAPLKTAAPAQVVAKPSIKQPKPAVAAVKRTPTATKTVAKKVVRKK